MRERVVNSQDVKPIERKSMGGARGAAGRRPGVRLPPTKTEPKKKSFLWVWVIIVALLGAAGAVVFFSGALDGLLK